MENVELKVTIRRINNGFINNTGKGEFAYLTIEELAKLFSSSFSGQVEKLQVGKSIEVVLAIKEVQ